MATTAAEAPSTGFSSLQMGVGGALQRAGAAIERWLEREREQLPLWIPVALGAGVTAWFVLPTRGAWLGFALAAASLALIAALLRGGGRLPRMLAVVTALAALGCVLMWSRAERVAAPVLARPIVTQVLGRVTRIEPLPARRRTRLTLSVAATPGVPARVRVNVPDAALPPGLTSGARIALRARLMPPAPAAVPGSYDFARVAWFAGIGATGTALGPVTRIESAAGGSGDLRRRLSAHIQSRLEGSAGGISSALATGDRGAIGDADAEAMRASGLAHLLSVSGLHVTAVTGAAMLVVLRLLALSPVLALRWRLPIVAAGAGAIAAIGYTWLTGGEVPTIRACAAALLVLVALSLGREAITLRLVAAGALFVLLLWPEALAGPSFQLSFAAVTAIVALHENPRVRGWFARREEGRGARLVRGLASLLLTGIAVEAALMPIALYHFHKAGLYGALANILAIPLTTFVIMPAEALALLLDLAGLGAPVWWLVGQALALLLRLAHATATAPGAVAALPAMPGGAFALIVAGGLWIALWRTRARLAGAVPLVAGFAWALATPAPDLLVTGDGRHVALRVADGRVALLRERTGDFTRAALAENSGAGEALADLGAVADARCSADLCLAERRVGKQRWRIAATRSPYLLPWREMIAICRSADVVVSDRRLPPDCRPRWLKLDRPALERSGGVAITLASGAVRTVRRGTDHPWEHPPRLARSPLPQ